MIKMLLFSLIKFSIFPLLVGLLLHDQGLGYPAQPESERSQCRLTILYDNNPHDDRLKSSWGFSCLIEGEGKTVLFDTGGDGEILLYNMRVLGRDPKKIDTIVLSHIHGDHTGGLWSILREKPTLKVYIPESFPQEFEQTAKRHGAEVVRVSVALEIDRGIYSTGEMGHGIKEQSLILNTPQGMVIVTGCAHPGIVETIQRAKTTTGREVYMVLGGFHLSGKNAKEIRDLIDAFREMKVQKAAPCHCTGDLAIAMFKNAYGKHFVKTGVGKILWIGGKP